MEVQEKISNRVPKTLLDVYKGLPEGTLIQLIKNQLIMSPSPSLAHQRVLADLFNRIYNYVEKVNSGIVLMAPFDVYFDNKNVFQPDIILVLNENLSHLKENGYYGAPDLAIEILSPRTGKYDLEDKMEVYAKYGVKEYWVIDPHEKRATGYWLVNDEYHSFSEEIGILNSQLLKKKIKF